MAPSHAVLELFEDILADFCSKGPQSLPISDCSKDFLFEIKTLGLENIQKNSDKIGSQHAFEKVRSFCGTKLPHDDLNRRK